MSDNPNEAKQLQMENEIPICGDGWLAVFDLIAPRQLGLEIALLSHRFDYYVNEHFRTRRWTLGDIRIKCKIDENGTNEMQIGNSRGEMMPFPQVPVPKKVVGFKYIMIRHGDQNVIEFLHHFRRLFASSGTYLGIHHRKETDFIEHFIWPLISSNICALKFDSDNLLSSLPLTTLILRDNCPSLRFIYAFDFYPTDNSSAALDGQALSKWLFTPRADGIPKVLRCKSFAQSKMDSFKAEFANASSPVNFIIYIWLRLWDYGVTLLTFELINHSTEEQMTLKQLDDDLFLLVRCPIASDQQKWAEWEEEAEWRSYNQWNGITFS